MITQKTVFVLGAGASHPYEFPIGVPKLRAQTFETAIIERYRRRESSVEEALIEMYLAGVSVRRVEDITEALWGTAGATLDGVGPEQEDLRNDRSLAQSTDREASTPTSIWMASCSKRSWAGEVRNVSLLVAIGVNTRVIGRFLASARVPKRTKRAGARSSRAFS